MSNPETTKWEYRYLGKQHEPQMDLHYLNLAGSDGWEVVHTDQYCGYLMKRRIGESA